jgi:hypothetical protein
MLRLGSSGFKFSPRRGFIDSESLLGRTIMFISFSSKPWILVDFYVFKTLHKISRPVRFSTFKMEFFSALSLRLLEENKLKVSTTFVKRDGFRLRLRTLMLMSKIEDWNISFFGRPT